MCANEHGDSHGVRGRRTGNGQLGQCGNGADGMQQSKAAPWQTRPERARALGKKKLTGGPAMSAIASGCGKDGWVVPVGSGQNSERLEPKEQC